MHGLLDVIGCRDVVDSILDKCGVMCLARLSLTSKSTREIIDEYNRRTKRIFPVRCGGFDHERHTFWATYKRERFEEAMKGPVAKLYELATAIESSEREHADEVNMPNQPSPLPSQADDTHRQLIDL